MEAERVWRDRMRDVMLAVGVTVLEVGAALTEPGTPGTELDAYGYALMLAPGLALLASRRAPVPVLLLASVCLAAYEVRDHPGDVVAFPVIAAVYAAVRRGHRPVLLAPVAALVVAIAGGVLTGDDGQSVYEAVQSRFLLAGWIVAAAMIGQAARNWEAYLEQVERRAEDAERSREEAALRRADEERLRIARELHDSLTHSISVIKVQAGVAVHLARKRGEEVPAALLAIQEAGSDASRELRSTLGVLRTADGADDGTAPSASGLGRLDKLLERARAAGLRASLTVTGERRPLPGDTDTAAYRIIQESLTNAARHAGPSATATVTVGYEPSRLTLRVEDDGRASPDRPVVPGTGLIGMRERVTALDGELEAGARPGGGFAVRARLPLAHQDDPAAVPGPRTLPEEAPR
ncbi:sensor histidine kinase [Streptomyces sp. NPDC048172]|uniref:sensor histidine kinase n=1 Tax=Streptomyces sp. NPDC048172 TaxID=3365505 RepID=UPI00371D7B5E